MMQSGGLLGTLNDPLHPLHGPAGFKEIAVDTSGRALRGGISAESRQGDHKKKPTQMGA